MSTNISATGRGSVAAGSITGSVTTGTPADPGGMRTFRQWLESQAHGESISAETYRWMEKAWMGAIAELTSGPRDLGDCPQHPGRYGDH